MGRSSKSISLVLIGPALVGSSLMISGCSPAVEEEPAPVVDDEWVVAANDVNGGYWGPPGEENLATTSHTTTNHVTHSSHRSNIGGFIGGYLGARAASGGGGSVAPSGPRPGMAPAAPSHSGGGSTSHVGGTSSRGGFGSSAGHASASS